MGMLNILFCRKERRESIVPLRKIKVKNSIKIVIVGDGAIGKTTLLKAYMNPNSYWEYMEEYKPTVLENFYIKIPIQDEEYIMDIWDTAGQEDLNNIRIKAYPNTDLFLLCFDASNYSSFANLKGVWFNETGLNEEISSPRLSRFSRKKEFPPAFITVATKTDRLRFLKRQKLRYVRHGEVKDWAEKCGSKAFVDCSAKKYHNVTLVFKTAFIEAVRRKRALKKQSLCQKCFLF
eukprot:maker-scaffold_2-snap-gene-25.65-mRNA-1 protein AED:0.00 eAED:0.00 QI:132/1/1/1/1/1/3/133/233